MDKPGMVAFWGNHTEWSEDKDTMSMEHKAFAFDRFLFERELFFFHADHGS